MPALRSIEREHRDGGRTLIILTSPHTRRTLAIGRAIGRAAPDGGVIAFHGDLGAGKTTLAKGIAQGLGIGEPVISPTYTIISEYPGRLRLVHIDAYRLSGEEEFAQTGGQDLLGMPGTLSLVEWSERVEELLPRERQRISITIEENGDRLFILEGDWLEALDWRRFSIPRLEAAREGTPGGAVRRRGIQ